MALTTLDKNTALIVIDLQKGIVAGPSVHPMDEIIERSGALADAFRRHRLPVVLVNVEGGAGGRIEVSFDKDRKLPDDFAQLVPGLHAQDSDIFITKRTWGAFSHTGLEETLKALGVTQVVITGVATSIGVSSTARQAFEAGFNVTLSIDAMTDFSPEAHNVSTRMVFPRLGETGTTDEILELLENTRS